MNKHIDTAPLKPISVASLQSKDIAAIAQYLMGKLLISNIDGEMCIGKIVETEAYRAPDDKASHAYNNKMTERTKVMYRQGGICYVYLIYCMHQMFNIVTGPEDIAHAVLIRALEPMSGFSIMEKRRSTTGTNLTNGPGKLCQALHITAEHNAQDITDNENNIWIAESQIL